MSAYAAHAALPSFADTQTLAEIRTHLDQLVTEAQTRAASYSAYTANLWEQISVSIDGGKLTRPALVVLGYQAFGGVRTQTSTPAVYLGHSLGHLLAFTRRGAGHAARMYRADPLTE
ncbi:hypothetical protein ACTXJU_15175 [Glutamicibacter ardleyensis]|uniref:hypothetical protein n=1 Tax=Glutamicibacter ardleyensis TaxID=225894 RepID=UPI003FCFDF1D